MAIKTFSGNDFDSRSWGGVVPQVSDEEWIRNPTWPALPSVGPTEQKVVGLYAVWPESNFIAMNCQGNYTVDFGDGTTNNYNSNVQANYEYSYSNSNLEGTDGPVTFTASTDTVSRTAHGYQSGYRVSFFNLSGGGGIMQGATYYVVNATADTFQISTTKGGSPLDITSDGTGTLLPYKIAVVTITPQSGQTLSVVNLRVKHNKTNLQNQYGTGWLDIQIGGAGFNTTGITIGGSDGTTVQHRMLERVGAVSFGSKINFDNFLHTSNALRTVDLGDSTANATSFSRTFQGCTTLITVPLFNTGSATNMTYMFYGCTVLKNVPNFNTANVTSMAYMFSLCPMLEAVPLFNTAKVTNMSYMFDGCSSLKYVPQFNTASVTNMSYMFRSCSSLKIVPLFNTANVTSMSYMFSACVSLETVPPFNTSNVTAMDRFFYGCSSLRSVPQFDTSNVTNMSSFFEGCSSLTTVPLLSTASATNFSYMFYNCYALTDIPAISVAGATASSSYTSMFGNCFTLSRIRMTGFKYTFSVQSCKLSSAALDELYGNLATVSGQTITVSWNHGTSADDPSIATAKGWTVTGS